MLGEAHIASLAKHLLNMDAAAVSRAAQTELLPFRGRPGQTTPALLLHSTTSTLHAFEGDLDDLLNGRHPHDVATYVEARSVFLGTSNDLTVGRTAPWAEAAALRGVPAVDIGDVEHYYLSQALLILAEAHEQGADTPLRRVIEWLSARPDAVIRLYALDLEAQIFLLWLRRKTGLPALATDANSPVVATKWNRKNHIHPTVAAALDLPASTHRLPPHELLDAEQRMSDARQQLGLRIPVLPGYTVVRTGISEDDFTDQILTAADLLKSRYGLRTAALKPSDAGDGARIVGNLDLDDTDKLASAARAAYPIGDDHLLEAWATFLSVDLDGTRVPVAPSGHIRDGYVAEGLTLQALDGFSWQGNTYVDESAWRNLGLPPDAYRSIRNSLEAIHAAFLGPQSIADGSYQGLVTGGIDFAVGHVGGRFDERLLVGAIDFNLSSHGAETLRVFRDRARRAGIAEPYAATRVLRPSADQTLHRMRDMAKALTPPGAMLEAVACVPRRWGMVAATGSDPATAARRANALISRAREPIP